MTAVQWILIAVVCGAIEIFTLGLWFLWLAIAALIVAGAVSVGWLSSLEVQLLVFAFLTLLFIIFTRPLTLKFFRTNDTVSNVNALIGQHGVATTNIEPLHFGQVKVNGEIWTAFSGEIIEEGSRIMVTGIDGVKLQVVNAME
ncbi:MAG: NfeD family protein [Syntrophomonadaceae bacterium]|nr:NfeD family protein [Syntrophomonadaceae bacterium]MDD4561678.1 NfeD family protein [Syntrophomonadaceae bacterium]